ncbi:universal stress protein [Povalibacter sp.]|uniref:universal stress protein n=1 Tax=Povalibacter sp. TaxID=1962978 RepID=UPI0039C970F1
MKPGRTILVPVDGSECSKRALEYAEKRTSSAGASLLVLNVQPVLPPSRFVSRAMVAEHQKRCADEALKSARAFSGDDNARQMSACRSATLQPPSLRGKKQALQRDGDGQ